MLADYWFMIVLLEVFVCGSTEFDFGSLTPSSLSLIGEAHWNNGSVRLTRDLAVPTSGAGKALYREAITFRQPDSRNIASFSTFFSFSVTNLNPSSIGGGLAFVLVPDEIIGSGGACLGLANESGDPARFVAVEFDTLMDVQFDDINGNHVGLDLNSMVSAEVEDLGAALVDLKSGNLVNVWISYDGSSRVLNVSVSYSNLKPKEPVMSMGIDLDQYVNDSMFVGFSGSTQGSTEVHSIEWWSFSSSLPKSYPDPDSDSDPPVPPPEVVRTTRTPSRGAVAGVVTASAFVLVFAGGLVWIFSKKFMTKPETETLIIKLPREFSYKELKLATKGFRNDRIIGYGAFGTVYKGVFPGGDVVAVKRCRQCDKGKDEFVSELSVISTLRHRNLVRLQGWCHEKGEILLVYDYMTNGSLDKALFEARIPLPWGHRRRVLIGVASALAYLHKECENQVIHRDVKSSNIMLDEFFNARLGDFGLARQIEHDKSPDATVAAGTMGYLAPEYLLTGRATEKTDVFSFGAVILEVSTGRRPIDNQVGLGGVDPKGSLVEWVWGLHSEGRILSSGDSRLHGEFDEADMRRVLLIGLGCSNPDPDARPSMRSVVQMLAGELGVPAVPRVKPASSFSTSQLVMSLEDSASDCHALLNLSSSSSEDGVVGPALV